MEELTYKLDEFEGPLDLLLTLIQKEKVSITDIPIALICDQYIAYLRAAEQMNMDIASEFIVMASELMLIKSKMLLPRPEKTDEEDPRAMLTELLVRYQQAKQGALKMAPLYAFYSARLVKDTDEISPDKTFVADQDVTSLVSAIRRVAAEFGSRPKENPQTFAPMIASPIVPVEVKIVGILHHMTKAPQVSLSELLSDSVSLPDMIAIFLGVLELVKMHRIVITEDPENPRAVFGTEIKFHLPEEVPDDGKPADDTDDKSEFN